MAYMRTFACQVAAESSRRAAEEEASSPAPGKLVSTAGSRVVLSKSRYIYIYIYSVYIYTYIHVCYSPLYSREYMI